MSNNPPLLIYLPKRTRRRQRGKLRTQLDTLALQRISQSMLWSMSTWGGSRCPDCGLKVPARFLTNLSGRIKLGENVGWITAYGSACHRVNNCPGVRPNWEFYVKN